MWPSPVSTVPPFCWPESKQKTVIVGKGNPPPVGEVEPTHYMGWRCANSDGPCEKICFGSVVKIVTGWVGEDWQCFYTLYKIQKLKYQNAHKIDMPEFPIYIWIEITGRAYDIHTICIHTIYIEITSRTCEGTPAPIVRHVTGSGFCESTVWYDICILIIDHQVHHARARFLIFLRRNFLLKMRANHFFVTALCFWSALSRVICHQHSALAGWNCGGWWEMPLFGNWYKYKYEYKYKYTLAG